MKTAIQTLQINLQHSLQQMQLFKKVVELNPVSSLLKLQNEMVYAPTGDHFKNLSVDPKITLPLNQN